MTIEIDRGHEIPMYSSVCTTCVHLTDARNRRCTAFPDGLPMAIWRGDHAHTTPYRGDHGVRYERLTVAELLSHGQPGSR
jgi:hypothetical protein